jgi:hypothetical protein
MKPALIKHNNGQVMGSLTQPNRLTEMTGHTSTEDKDMTTTMSSDDPTYEFSAPGSPHLSKSDLLHNIFNTDENWNFHVARIHKRLGIMTWAHKLNLLSLNVLGLCNPKRKVIARKWLDTFSKKFDIILLQELKADDFRLEFGTSLYNANVQCKFLTQSMDVEVQQLYFTQI